MTKVNGFQCKAISTRSSILDIADVPDPPLITIFGKVIFNLMQATVILFNLIAIYGRSYLNGCFGLLTKIKNGSGTSFTMRIFCMVFSYKCSLFNILSIDEVPMLHIFSFWRYQAKCIVKSLFRQLMTSESVRFIVDHPLKQWPTGKKWGEDRKTKNWISREWKELFRWNKKPFP